LPKTTNPPDDDSAPATGLAEKSSFLLGRLDDLDDAVFRNYSI